jgi:hypothetical protein
MMLKTYNTSLLNLVMNVLLILYDMGNFNLWIKSKLAVYHNIGQLLLLA